MVEKTSRLQEYKYAAVVIGIGVLALLILIFVALVPSWKKLSKTTEDLKSAQAEQEKLIVKLDNLKQLKKKEKELEEKNAKVLAALPEDNDVSRLFVEFEGIAESSGLAVKSVSESAATGTTPTGSIIVPVSYTISATSPDYASLKSALSKFEEALRLISITGVDVSASSGEGGGLSVNFSVTAYKRGATK